MKAVVSPARWALALAVLATAGPVSAQVSLTTLGSAYTQDFNTLALSGTTNTTLPTGWAFVETGTSANTTYAASTGSDNAGNTYSYGTAASTDRAFGSLQSGSVIPVIGAQFSNGTGATIDALAIAFTTEQWRIGNNTTARDDRLDFEYSTDATSLSTGTWTAVTALNAVNPIKTAATAGALDGNATANRTAVSSSISGLTIANGTTFWIRWKDFNATGADDGVAIDDFSLTPSGALPLPDLSIDDVTVTEGAAGNTVTATFTVSLSTPATAAVTFNIATADDSATVADNDYVARSLTAQTIAIGQSSFTFDVTVNGDSAIEPNEQFFVNVSSVSGANVTDGQGVGTISNDDALVPQLTINDVSVAEGNSGTSILQFTVTSSVAAPAGGYTVTATTADDTATVANSDYAASTGTVTIAAGATRGTFDVTINGDTTVEPDEQFFVNLSNAPAGTQIGDAQGVGTITNDDALPTLTVGNASVVEGNSGQVGLEFTVTLSGPAPAGGVNYTINTANGTATAPSDYIAFVNTSASIAAGQTTGTFSVIVNGDTTPEANETLTVTLSNLVNATAGASLTATGTITNDDAVEIHAIQGDGLAGPLVGQTVLTKSNIVTGKGPQGFTMQAPDARADADPNTSEGIYVFTSSTPTVFVGDMVDVSGTALEFNGLTEIGSATVTVTSTGNTLPTPVEFNATTPSPNPATPSCVVSASNYECFEFMRVRIANGLVNTGNQRFGSPATETYAEVFVTANGRRGVREPGLLYPLVPTAGNLAAGQWDGNPEMFEVDADYFGAVPQDTPITGGTRFNAVGVLGYDFGDYELWATEFNVVDAAPVPRAVRDSKGASDLRIGSFNMLRFCDTTNNGTGSDPCLAPTPTVDGFAYKVARLSKYINEVLKAPDVLGAVEVENLAVLQALAAKLSTDSGFPYVARLEEGNDIGGIDVGFLVRTDRVAITSVTQLGKTVTWNDPTGSPTALLNDRPPLLLQASFTTGGNRPFAVMVVHPKSRSCVDQTGGATCVQADVDRNRQKRFLQGKYHAEQIQAFQQANPGVIFSVVGDFNDYQFSDGWTHMLGAMEGTYDDAANLLDYTGNTVVSPKLWNAVMSVPENERYSFLFTENFGVFQGFNTRDLPTQQSLDHALLNVTARSLFAGFDYGRADNDAPAEWERLCNVVPTPPATVPPGCPNIAIAVSDHDGLVFVLATDRIFADGVEPAP